MPIDLGTLGGNFSDAIAVNANGQVVGFSFTAADERHAFSGTEAGGVVDLGTFGGDFSVAGFHATLWHIKTGGGKS